jgi:outer membrane protein
MMRITTVFLAIFMFALSAAAADLKIGHVDLQRLMAQSDAGKEMRKLYLDRAKKYQDEINDRSERLKKLKEEIEAKAKGLKEGEKVPQEIIDKDKEYGVQARELQRLLGGYQDELKVYDAELTGKVLNEFAPVLKEYATRNKFDYIFIRTDTLAYGAEKLDLTEELIDVFNRKHGKR